MHEARRESEMEDGGNRGGRGVRVGTLEDGSHKVGGGWVKWS